MSRAWQIGLRAAEAKEAVSRARSGKSERARPAGRVSDFPELLLCVLGKLLAKTREHDIILVYPKRLMGSYYHKNTKTTRQERTALYNLERELKIRGLSRRTIESYLLYNRLFLEFANKCPSEVANEDIRKYLESLLD